MEESSAVVLGAERLEVPVAPLEPSPNAVLVAMAEWNPPLPVMPPTVLLMLAMLARWLMLLLLLLLWAEWSDEFVGCEDV